MGGWTSHVTRRKAVGGSAGEDGRSGGAQRSEFRDSEGIVVGMGEGWYRKGAARVKGTSM